MKIAELKTFVVGNPPPAFGGRYFLFLKPRKDAAPPVMPFPPVMAGLVPAIYAGQSARSQALRARWLPVANSGREGDDVDGRDKPGHDGFAGARSAQGPHRP